MDVIITPQAAADAGCGATSTSQPYSDSVIGSSGHVTFEFNGSFPILYVTRAGRWKLKEIKILTRRDWWNDISQSGTGTETLYGYMGDGYTRTYGDRIDFLQFMKDANPDWYPIARHNPIDPPVAHGVQNWFFEDGTQYAESTYEIMSMTLVFEESDDILISTSASPADAGTTTGGGLYSPGSSVTIKATPNEGYVFQKWTKDEVDVSYSANYSFNATKDESFVAVFVPKSDSLTFVFKNGYGESLSGINVRIDGTDKSATTDATGVAKIYGVPLGLNCTFVISNYLTDSFLIVGGTYWLALVTSQKFGLLPCQKRRSNNDFVIWNYYGYYYRGPDVIEFMSTKPFQIGVSARTIGGVGYNDPNCDMKFLDAFGNASIYNYEIAGSTSRWYNLVDSTIAYGYPMISGQGAAEIKGNPRATGPELPGYALGAFRIDIPQETIDAYLKLGYKLVVQCSLNTIYGHHDDKVIDVAAGETIFYTDYGVEFEQDRPPNFAYKDITNPGCAFAYLDIIPVGIIYDPSSGKIMHDANAGSILCYT